MFHYYETPPTRCGAVDDERFVALVPTDLEEERQLIAAVGRALLFPWYCGYNLDALWDCLRDLDWIDARSVELVHQDLPSLPPGRAAAYLQLLVDTVRYWRGRPDEHSFDVYFPAPVRPTVESALNHTDAP